ncbi:MAG: D-glycerate dehydrogenase [Desulfobacterales bacterium]|nr:D-glycerate dehydrogenase [Desulfobacterales bacterium]
MGNPVFISRPIPEKALSLLRSECDIDMWPDAGTPPPLRDRAVEAEGILTYGHEPIDDDLMKHAKTLKVVSVIGVGYDHVDVKAATRRGIAVGHTPGTLDDTVADFTMGLIIAVARNVVAGDAFVRTGMWKSFNPNFMWGSDVDHATLGILGMGNIGSAIARRARAFDMRIIYHNRTRRPEYERLFGAVYAPLPSLLAESDFIVIQAPLTDETHHLIGEDEFSLMKKSAFLINTARGPIVDSQALRRALQDGAIAGAALDVYDPEPPSQDDPLLEMKNVVLCPHLGSATIQTRTKMAVMAAENLLAGLRNQPLPYGVNCNPNA